MWRKIKESSFVCSLVPFVWASTGLSLSHALHLVATRGSSFPLAVCISRALVHTRLDPQLVCKLKHPEAELLFLLFHAMEGFINPAAHIHTLLISHLENYSLRSSSLLYFHYSISSLIWERLGANRWRGPISFSWRLLPPCWGGYESPGLGEVKNKTGDPTLKEKKNS